MQYDYIKQGDCLELMKDIPDNSINLVLTDPPYNISRKNNFTTLGRTGIDFGEWDKSFNQLAWLNELPRILSANASIVIFNDWKNMGDITKYCEELGFVVKDMLRWVKTNPMPRNRDRRYITDYECAVWLTNKNAKWTYHRLSDTYQRPEFNFGVVSGKEKTAHPTQKPIALIQELLKIHSNEGDIILDPFLGSGTTAVACINTNRHYIGFELDEKYFEIAQKRINDTLEGLT